LALPRIEPRAVAIRVPCLESEEFKLSVFLSPIQGWAVSGAAVVLMAALKGGGRVHGRGHKVLNSVQRVTCRYAIPAYTVKNRR
jgi:hypothetical protein